MSSSTEIQNFYADDPSTSPCYTENLTALRTRSSIQEEMSRDYMANLRFGRPFETPVDAILLAAGAGTRMRPLSYTTSKPMLPVANRPLLAILAENLSNAGFRSITIVISPANQSLIREFFANHPISNKTTLKFVVQEQTLGTGHALLVARQAADSEIVFAMAGDNYLPTEFLCRMVKFHTKHRPEVTMALKRVPLKVISSLSSVILTPKGYVTRIIEKPKPQEVLSSVAATAAYTFERGLFDILSKISRSDRGEYEVPTAFQQIIEMNGRIMGLEANEWDHISNPEDLWRINMQRTRTNCIDESATIGKGSRLKHCVIGGRVTVGEDSRLEHCLVLAGTVVPARSLHDNSVLYNQKGTELEVVSFSGSIMRSSPYDVRNG